MSKQAGPSQSGLLGAISRGTKRQGGKKARKYGRNLVVCARYRARVGKPLGRGVPGNKRGKKKVVRARG
jgi:hypothetical protein